MYVLRIIPQIVSLTHFQIAVGTKSGELLLYDLSTSTLVETYKAHTATLWSLHVRHDQQALVTGSADKDVKFWNFESMHSMSSRRRVMAAARSRLAGNEGQSHGPALNGNTYQAARQPPLSRSYPPFLAMLGMS